MDAGSYLGEQPAIVWQPRLLRAEIIFTQQGQQGIAITLNNDVVAGQDSLYATASMDNATRELIIKLVNASAKRKPIPYCWTGKKMGGAGCAHGIKSDDLYSVILSRRRKGNTVETV